MLGLGAALFAPACGDPTSGSGGAAGHGTGANSSTTSTSTTGNAGSSASGGTGGNTSSGGNNTGGNTSSGGTSTGGNNTGGNPTGGNNTGGNPTGGNTGGTGMAGSGMGGVAGNGGVAGGGTGGGTGGGGPVQQPDNWGAPPLVMMPALPPKPDLSGYPLDANGKPILVPGATFNMVAITTPDAMTARDACAALVSNCYSPGVRSMDACMMSAPPCLTTTPWMEATACCAQTCMDGYAALRTAKVDPVNAYLKVLYDGPVCMPGVDTMLAGGVP